MKCATHSFIFITIGLSTGNIYFQHTHKKITETVKSSLASIEGGGDIATILLPYIDMYDKNYYKKSALVGCSAIISYYLLAWLENYFWDEDQENNRGYSESNAYDIDGDGLDDFYNWNTPATARWGHNVYYIWSQRIIHNSEFEFVRYYKLFKHHMKKMLDI